MCSAHFTDDTNRNVVITYVHPRGPISCAGCPPHRVCRYYPADDGISVMEVGAGMSNGAKFLSKARVRKGTGRE